MIAVLLSLATFASTFIGGLFALRFRNRLNLIMGFAAGVILGVIAFDILPEIIAQTHELNIDPVKPMIALVVGFLFFHILEKTIVIHHAHEGDYADHKHPQVGVASALALIGHSLMDGISIGLGFQINPAVGIVVALAVISHDFTDGINTITLMVSHKNTLSKSMAFLVVDALAPVVGAISTMFFHVSVYYLTIYLGAFAGFLLYIGASDILPEAHSEKSSYTTILLTVAGVALTFAITRAL